MGRASNGGKGREREIAEPSGSRLRKPTRASGYRRPLSRTRARKGTRGEKDSLVVFDERPVHSPMSVGKQVREVGTALESWLGGLDSAASNSTYLLGVNLQAIFEEQLGAFN